MKTTSLPSNVTPESVPELFYKDQPVMTTEALSVLYGTNPEIIRKNYQRNTKRFASKKHFFKISGDTLKDFLRVSLRHSQISENPQKTRTLMLWTERGAALHAKMLETDQAWKTYEYLVDFYFNRVPYGVIKGTGPSSKEQKLARIATTLTNAKKIARTVGLLGDEAILKAVDLTQETIGVDVFTLLDVSPPKSSLDPDKYPEETEAFYQAMDQLLASGELKDHGDKVEIVWIHMPTALPVIEKHLGRSLDRSLLYLQLKKSDRYIEQKNAKRSRVFKKPIRAWAFKKQHSKSA